MFEKLAYRPAEVQASLGIKPSKFWSLVKDGQMQTRKMGRATVISADDLKNFVANLPKADEA